MTRNDYDDDEGRVIVERRGSSGTTMGALLAGIAIGAGLALLFAPQSGEATRTLLQRKGRRARRLARNYADELKERAEDVAKSARERSREFVDEARGAIEDRVDETRRAINTKRRAFRQRPQAEHFKILALELLAAFLPLLARVDAVEKLPVEPHSFGPEECLEFSRGGRRDR